MNKRLVTTSYQVNCTPLPCRAEILKISIVDPGSVPKELIPVVLIFGNNSIERINLIKFLKIFVLETDEITDISRLSMPDSEFIVEFKLTKEAKELLPHNEELKCRIIKFELDQDGDGKFSTGTLTFGVLAN
jgi:hypothetical protein